MRHNDLRKQYCGPVTPNGLTNGGPTSGDGASDAGASGGDATNDDGASDGGASPNDADANDHANAPAPASPDQHRPVSLPLIPHLRYAGPEDPALREPAPVALRSRLQQARSGPLLFQPIQKQISVSRGVACVPLCGEFHFQRQQVSLLRHECSLNRAGFFLIFNESTHATRLL